MGPIHDGLDYKLIDVDVSCAPPDGIVGFIGGKRHGQHDLPRARHATMVRHHSNLDWHDCCWSCVCVRQDSLRAQRDNEESMLLAVMMGSQTDSS